MNGADMFVHNGAVRRQDKGFWHAIDPPLDASAAIRIGTDQRVRVTQLIEESHGVGRRVPLIDAVNRPAFLVQPHQDRVLDPARPAP